VGYQSSFVSQIIPAKVSTRAELVRVWNSLAMKWGRLDIGNFKLDLGTVIPSILLIADIPDIVSLISRRKLLYCQTRDNGQPGSHLRQERFRRVLKAVGQDEPDWAWYYPDRQFDTQLLMSWLKKVP
jgi:hypothetical protein